MKYLLPLLLLLPFQSKAQALYENTNPLSNEIWYETGWTQVVKRFSPLGLTNLRFHFVKYSDSSFFIELDVTVRGRNFDVRENNYLGFEFGDGQRILFPYAKDAYIGSNNAYNATHPKYVVKKEQMTQLKDGPVKMFFQTYRKTHEIDLADHEIASLVRNAFMLIDGTDQKGKTVTPKKQSR